MTAKSRRIVTWNINSVRLRLPIVLKLLEEMQPDVLCLQEIKCTNEQFAALYKRHHELKERVTDAELGTRPINHDSLGVLKREKLQTKDKMAAIIAEYRR